MKKPSSKFLKISFLLLALILTLSPFLYLARYNHPSADDFCYTSKANYLGFAATQADHWNTWSGRFTATAILSIFKLDHNNLFGYRLLPVLLFISFGFSILFFLKSLFPKTSIYDIWALSFAIFFLYIFKAPNITEAFYWLSGSVTYQVASILTLFLFSVILALLDQNVKWKIYFLTVLGSLMGILIVGLNEVSLFYLCSILFLWIAIKVYLTSKIDWGFIIIVTTTILAASVSIAAPGNYMRIDNTTNADQFNLSFSISSSIELALNAIITWLPLMLLMVIIFWGSFNRIAFQTKDYYNTVRIRGFHIIALIILLFAFMVAGYFPTFWTQGGEPPSRTVNVILLLFLFGSVGIILLSLKVFGEKINLPKAHFLIKTIAVGIIFSYIYLFTNNIKSAYKDIAYRKALNYDKEMKERYRVLENCEGGLCGLPLRLTSYPPTIFAYELALHPLDEIYWYNSCLKDYFYKTYTPPVRKLKEKKILN